MRERFSDAGFCVTPDSLGVADICVVNTCAVTTNSEAQGRHLIHNLLRRNPKPFIIVTGCCAEVRKERFQNIDGVNLVIGPSEQSSILENINKKLEHKFSSYALSSKTGISAFDGHKRAFVKIQDGCDAFCSFCIVPYARGEVRRRNVKDVVEEVEKLVKVGFKEIVLTGTHLDELNLIEIIACLEEIHGLQRIRISSLEPEEISERLINKIASSQKICKHLHIPMQSGDNEILMRMKRRTKVEDFYNIVKRLKQVMPNMGLGTDIIVGFPGENEKAFQNTYDVVNRLPFTYLHVFPFSPREGTEAFSFSDKVHQSVIKERAKRMRLLGMMKKIEFMREHIGKEIEVLVEETIDKFYCRQVGWSDNYVRVLVDGNINNIGCIIKVKALSLQGEYIVGTV